VLLGGLIQTVLSTETPFIGEVRKPSKICIVSVPSIKECSSCRCPDGEENEEGMSSLTVLNCETLLDFFPGVEGDSKQDDLREGGLLRLPRGVGRWLPLPLLLVMVVGCMAAGSGTGPYCC
jgi:hypothetical protein